jgi:predicted  nucleic acid-binding Zn-ribbon protein
MRSAAELMACVDLLSRESGMAVAVLTSENARLRDELLASRGAADRKEVELKTAQAALDSAISEHARGRLEAETVHRRLEEEKKFLTESLNAAQGEVVRLKESLVGADQALKEQEGLVRKAESDAEAQVRRAGEDLKRIRVAYYLKGHLDGEAGLPP